MVLAIVVLPIPGGPYKKIDVPETTEAPIRDSISSDKTSWQNALSTSDGFNATRRTLHAVCVAAQGERPKPPYRLGLRQPLSFALRSHGGRQGTGCFYRFLAPVPAPRPATSH